MALTDLKQCDYENKTIDGQTDGEKSPRPSPTNIVEGHNYEHLQINVAETHTYDNYRHENVERSSRGVEKETSLNCWRDAPILILLSLHTILIIIMIVIIAILFAKSQESGQLGRDGGWSMWDSWTECSATCNIGMTHRKRTCSGPTPSNGGQHCFGESIEYQLCQNSVCVSANCCK